VDLSPFSPLDANGNRTMSGYLTAANNRVTSDGTYNYQYDHEGHRIKQTEIATGKVTSYTWDFRGRLTDITYQASSYVNSHVYRRIHYTYDGFDRLINKEIDTNGDGTYETSESYVYDGANIVLVLNSAGSVTNRYLQGPGVDQVLADEQVTSASQTPNTVLWALSDNQGTVRDWAQKNTTTGQTQIVDHIVYDAYGQIVSQTNPQTHLAATNKIRFGYTGQIWDADAKLYYYRARWYDPHIGKFTSEDPLGFGAGDTNVQRYVGNSPTNATDPSGLAELDLSWVNPGIPIYGEAETWLDRAKAAYAMEQSGQTLPIGQWSAARLLRQARNAYNTQQRNHPSADLFAGTQAKLDKFRANPGVAGTIILTPSYVEDTVNRLMIQKDFYGYQEMVARLHGADVARRQGSGFYDFYPGHLPVEARMDGVFARAYTESAMI
jgi:RHS repeat-associated protein